MAKRKVKVKKSGNSGIGKRLNAILDRLDSIDQKLGLLMTDKVPEGAQSVAPPTEEQPQ